MQKVNITKQKTKLLVGEICLITIIGVIVIFTCFTSTHGIRSRLDAKIKEYSENYGITVDEIKKDKLLLDQLQMEADQEEKIDKLTEDITITKEEISNYREMIGTTMDVKKAVFILFNTFDECKLFINEYGSKDDVTKLGIGVIPLMQTDDSGDYYNVVGNEALEAIFDSLKDREHTNEPFSFSGMYGYMRRIGLSSPIESEEKLIELIKSEKAHEMLQNQKTE